MSKSTKMTRTRTASMYSDESSEVDFLPTWIKSLTRTQGTSMFSPLSTAISRQLQERDPLQTEHADISRPSPRLSFLQRRQMMHEESYPVEHVHRYGHTMLPAVHHSMGLFGRTSSFGRRASNAIRRSRSIDDGITIQGKELVHALQSKAHAHESDVGSSGEGFMKLSERFIRQCCQLLSIEPAERSFKDLDTIMSLINHVPVLNSLSAVDKYLICRQGRYITGEVDEMVFNDYSNALLLVLSGTLESSDNEMVEPGSVLGIKEFKDTMEDKDYVNESSRETKYIVKTQALLLRVDLMECKMAFNAYERSQRQGLTSFAFIASSLSCVNIFQSWSWLDVLALVKDVEGVQIDKDVYLSRFASLAVVAYS
ncbi:hypothetical protein GUITHDRAFT_102031 [Guillardia theta CCMP2712]|uniref:Cyclic nucleotide-binding domain-containing protein n=1 Tax=Guillardia theta (strain CCMP2712) TaxID=905079 RepID=L1JV94_GUITC|nr:hypothetical protein GUITHDRAFT_102031 [Guillardia theta CCMP2712]EKX52130.1 hypothetical protein GUITHDRAFT_102031 [Guillardia theta CCMP2712]|eukprot:XP_005839110.1 hypothetical protein GUITHDRAFT_102031 [Guillardia theta CCMP2712]